MDDYCLRVKTTTDTNIGQSIPEGTLVLNLLLGLSE